MTSILAGFRLKNPFCADNILCGLNSDSACPSLRAGEPVHPSVDQGLIDSLAPVLRPAAFEVLRNAGLPLFVVGTLIEQERPLQIHDAGNERRIRGMRLIPATDLRQEKLGDLNQSPMSSV